MRLQSNIKRIVSRQTHTCSSEIVGHGLKGTQKRICVPYCFHVFCLLEIWQSSNNQSADIQLSNFFPVQIRLSRFRQELIQISRKLASTSSDVSRLLPHLKHNLVTPATNMRCTADQNNQFITNKVAKNLGALRIQAESNSFHPLL